MHEPFSPPSSRNGERRLLAVAIQSVAMQQLFAETCTLARRGVYLRLVIPPEDMRELMAFGNRVADKLRINPPHVIHQHDTTLMNDERQRELAALQWLEEEEETNHSSGEFPLSDLRALIIPKGTTIPRSIRQEMLKLHNPRNPRPFALAAFPSEKASDAALAEWPEELRKLFERKPLFWPSIASRKHDIPAIAANVVAHRLGDPDTKIAISHEAQRTLKETKWTHVAALRAAVLAALDNAVTFQRSRIEACDLDQKPRSSRPPKSHRQPQTASSPPPSP